MDAVSTNRIGDILNLMITFLIYAVQGKSKKLLHDLIIFYDYFTKRYNVLSTYSCFHVVSKFTNLI